MSTEKKEEIKHAGWKTTECWATVAGAVVLILNTLFEWHLPGEAIGGLAGIIASYVLGRSFAKGMIIKEQVKADVASNTGSNK